MEDRSKRGSEFREGIFHVGWDDGEDLAIHDAIALQLAKRLRQHLLRYSVERSRQLVVTKSAPSERVNDKDRPFVRDDIKDLARRAGGMEHISPCVFYSFHRVSIAQYGIYLQIRTYIRHNEPIMNNLFSMEKDILSAMKWRYAVQVFDTSKKLNEKDVETILEAGRLAPSSYGLEAWKFIVVTNPDVRAKLSAVGYGQQKITGASHLIVIARRTDARERIVGERIARTALAQGQKESELAGFADMLSGVIAGRNDEELAEWLRAQTYIPLGVMMETASLLGIDNAAMEGFNNQGVDEVLGLPDQHLASVTMLALGYRAKEDSASARPKVRRAKEDVVSYVK